LTLGTIIVTHCVTYTEVTTVRGTLHFGVWVLLALSLPALAVDRNWFYARAPYHSSADSKYKYDPDTGELCKLAGEGKDAKFAPLEGFPKIKGLGRNDIEVFPVEGASPAPFILVRHGHWYTIFDLERGLTIATNVGPIEPMQVDRVLTAFFPTSEEDKYSGVIFFTGKSMSAGYLSAEVKEPSLLLFIHDFKHGLRWMPLRNDLNPAKDLAIEQRSPDQFHLKISMMNSKLRFKQGPDGEPVLDGVDKEIHTGEADLDVSDGKLVNAPGESLTSAGALTKEISTRALFADGHNSTFNSAKLKLEGVLPGTLKKTGNPEEKSAQLAAMEASREFIAQENRIGRRVREAMKKIKGQQEAIEQLVGLAQLMPGATSHTVAMLAGPTAVGKTSGAEAFGRALADELRTDSEKIIFRFSFAESPDATYAQTKLFGSSAGFVGSTDVPPLMLWLLNNPKGGVAIFDEFDKATARTASLLQSFFETGELTIAPNLVSAIISKYAHTPIPQWPPALAKATMNGKNTNVEIRLKLTNMHAIFVGTNIGAELFTGNDGISNVTGKRLKTQDEIAAANVRFTPEYIKSRARARGYPDDQLSRYGAFIPFRALLLDSHRAIVKEALEDLFSSFEKRRLISLNASPELQEYLETATYTPLEGARDIRNLLKRWIAMPLNRAVLGESPAVRPGDELTLTLKPGSDTVLPRLEFRNGKGKVIADSPIGKPVRRAPVELLALLQKNLKAELESTILGHKDELPAIAQAIIGPVAEACDEDENDAEGARARQAGEEMAPKTGLPILKMMDGVSGNGKTEIARAVSRAAKGKLIAINAADIQTPDDFDKVFLKPLRAEAQANPEAIIVLLDEFHRAGGVHEAFRRPVQERFMRVFDEGVLPAARDEVRYEQGIAKQISEPVVLPPATIFLMTSNLAQELLGGNVERLSNRELLAQMRSARSHPEQFKAVYDKYFIPALRSRMGEPMLLLPLEQSDLDKLRDRFLDGPRKYLKKRGVEFSLSPSVEEYMEQEFIAVRGGRWLRTVIRDYIRAPMVSLVATGKEKLEGKHLVLEFDKKTRALTAVIHDGSADGPVVGTEKLIVIPKERTEYHPEAIRREAEMTTYHEIGHVVARLALMGLGSVREVNTYASGGGVTYFATDLPNQPLSLSNLDIPKRLAISLGGHQAEKMVFKRTTTGAISDYANTRDAAQHMVIDGGTFEDAPIAVVKNPSTGQVQFSERNLVRIERRTEVLMRGSGRLVRFALEQNKELVGELAKALLAAPDLRLDRDQIDNIARGKLKPVTDADIERVMLEEKSTRSTCAKLLGFEIE